MNNTLLAPCRELHEFETIWDGLRKGKTPIAVTGCVDAQKAHLVYGSAFDAGIRVIIVEEERKGREFCEDYHLYDPGTLYYPPKDILFYDADIRGTALTAERLQVIRRLLSGEPVTIVTTIDAGMDPVLPLSQVEEQVFTLHPGDVLSVDDWSETMIRLGYDREAEVSAPGQFSVRGGILDLFPLVEDVPYRIELWGDEIDTIRSFDVESQRSIEQVDELSIYPASEWILSQDQLERGIARIKREAAAQALKMRNLGNGEAARRLESLIEERVEEMTYFRAQANIDAYLPFFFQETVSFFDTLRELGTVFFLDEPGRLFERGKAVEEEYQTSMKDRLERGEALPTQARMLYSCRYLVDQLARGKTVLMGTMDARLQGVTPKISVDLTVRSVSPYHNNMALLISDLKKWKTKGYRMLVMAGSSTRAKRLSQDLFEEGLSAFYGGELDRVLSPGETMVAAGTVRRGFEYPLIKFVVLSDQDIFGERGTKKRRKRYRGDGKAISDFHELSVGDYVIHESHGLGIYRGIEKIQVDYVTKDYIKLEYADGGILYIPATGLEVLQKYASGDAEKNLKLNKLGTPEWKVTKGKARKEAQSIAKDLLELYARRSAKQGYAFSPDTVWQKEFEDQFPYEETEDQLKAIEETKRDMESTKIMDRLICGDVGYGKTEIAIRAAFKAVNDGKQVVFLAPTTILVQQHYNTFLQRMKDYPIVIEMLSRFRTQKQQTQIKEGLRKGMVDIVIGTHSVLSNKIEYKNLGLLIIDEEQRFGVRHKERIKQMKDNVDVLTLTATPIPRTLHMSLVGIRDMSVLEEPPRDRAPIQTFVMEHNDELIREAIRREYKRGGQVYYIYNRVTNIPEIAKRVSDLVPEVTVAYAHGQMNERELEQIMMDFVSGQIDVLVSTTIVETGMDISNVNTIIIDDADRMGLAQLYQLRGRVGRSNRIAYAFLMYRKDKQLKEVAEKRLEAIKEYTDLGSGFRVAMRDLEIRGAGDLLGAQQHGHMQAVGYDLYCKMLNEAIRRMKGEIVEEEPFETSVDLDMDAYLPPSFIHSEAQKLDLYKRIAGIETEEECEDMRDELFDRFGELPQEADNLLQAALLKAAAHRAGVVQVTKRGSRVTLILYEKAKVNPAGVVDLLKRHGGNVRFKADAKAPTFIWMLQADPKKGGMDGIFLQLRGILEEIQGLQEAEQS